MADETVDQGSELSNWAQARLVWAAGSVDIPEHRDRDNAHYLHDLRSITAMYFQATEVNETDQSRSVTARQIAGQCRTLHDALSKLDFQTLSRLSRRSNDDFDDLLNDTISGLMRLETLFAGVDEPTQPRKRKHELNDMAIIRLAEVFEGATGDGAGVTKGWEGSDRSGRFVEFVFAFYEYFLPDYRPQISGRSIDASLAKREEWKRNEP